MQQRDDLTQLFSRGTFETALQEAVGEAIGKNLPLGLVLVDIDHFKTVNDTHGHPVGDAVLRELARRLESATWGKGKVYRYGGEEIAMILRNHSAEEALAVAERSRRLIEKEPIDAIPVSMSFGVACLPDHASDADSLLRAADKALYDAKDRGRNLVRLFGEPAPAKRGPREPGRKAPEAGKLTDHQRAELRRRLLRQERIECPEDGAFLEVRDISNRDSIGREFGIVCPECGLRDVLRGDKRVV